MDTILSPRAPSEADSKSKPQNVPAIALGVFLAMFILLYFFYWIRFRRATIKHWTLEDQNRALRSENQHHSKQHLQMRANIDVRDHALIDAIKTIPSLREGMLRKIPSLANYPGMGRMRQGTLPTAGPPSSGRGGGRQMSLPVQGYAQQNHSNFRYGSAPDVSVHDGAPILSALPLPQPTGANRYDSPDVFRDGEYRREEYRHGGGTGNNNGNDYTVDVSSYVLSRGVHTQPQELDLSTFVPPENAQHTTRRLSKETPRSNSQPHSKSKSSLSKSSSNALKGMPYPASPPSPRQVTWSEPIQTQANEPLSPLSEIGTGTGLGQQPQTQPRPLQHRLGQVPPIASPTQSVAQIRVNGRRYKSFSKRVSEIPRPVHPNLSTQSRDSARSR
ncbi:hypothetical protein MKZ38_002726 [Zalerion maritima]|uniref:Uncharacterized protein n=1 Tax=Zalerion maritima TaxID=339359 RepID=A0AAD5WS74_9PEZI|nr:hypothetical protein MKZ38_002726 [Zalerion maritima]